MTRFHLKSSPHAPREEPMTHIAYTGNNHHGHALRESFPHAEREDYVLPFLGHGLVSSSRIS